MDFNKKLINLQANNFSISYISGVCGAICVALHDTCWQFHMVIVITPADGWTDQIN